MAAKKTTPAPAQSKALTVWDEEFAELAEKMGDARRETGGDYQYISMSAAGFSHGDDMLGTELNVCILDVVLENQYFDTAYDADNIQPPVCYAMGRKEKDLAPHEASEDPQCATCCADCEKNVFGSGQGNAKACKNVVKLFCILENDFDDMENAQIYVIKVSPTNAKYVTEFQDKLKNPNLQLGKMPRPFQVVAKLEVSPSKKTQYQLAVSIEEVMASDYHAALKERVRAQLDKPFQAYAKKAEEEEKPKASSKPSKFNKKK